MIECGQQGINLRLNEIGEDKPGRFLDWDRTDLAIHTMYSGLRSPTKRANAWSAASRWLRVAIERPEAQNLLPGATPVAKAVLMVAAEWAPEA